MFTGFRRSAVASEGFYSSYRGESDHSLCVSRTYCKYVQEERWAWYIGTGQKFPFRDWDKLRKVSECLSCFMLNNLRIYLLESLQELLD